MVNVSANAEKCYYAKSVPPSRVHVYKIIQSAGQLSSFHETMRRAYIVHSCAEYVCEVYIFCDDFFSDRALDRQVWLKL